MERDFMGLSSKQPLLVKEEVDDIGFKDTGCCKNSAEQSSYVMSFKANQGVNSLKNENNMPLSSAFRPFSASKIQQVVAASGNNGLFRYPFATSALNPLLLAGIPIRNPRSVVLPIMNPFSGFSEPRKNNMGSTGSPQLAIFYEGTVNIFDEISPEKIQAIMSLANQKARVQEPDSTSVSESSNSTATAQARIGSNRTDKYVGTNATHHAIGSFCTSTMIPSVPQARKASLARFLEKRKERLMNAAVPYKIGKKFLLESETGESSGMNYYPASEAA